MKYNLPLTDEYRLALEEAIASNKTLLQAGEIEKQKDARIVERSAALELEIRQLNKQFKSGDLDCLESLTSKKLQWAQISTLPPKQSAKEELAIYYGPMLRMNELVRPILLVLAADLRTELEATFRPFYQNDGAAKDAAGQTWISQALGHWINSLPEPGAPKRSIIRMIAVAENLLAGEEFWTFDPMIKP